MQQKRKKEKSNNNTQTFKKKNIMLKIFRKQKTKREEIKKNLLKRYKWCEQWKRVKKMYCSKMIKQPKM